MESDDSAPVAPGIGYRNSGLQMPDERIQTAVKFLKWLFDPLMKREEPLYIAIWCFPSKATYFFNDIRAAAVRAIELSDQNQNVYFGLGLHGQPASEGRGTAKDVIAINCLWADIDFDDPEAHKPKTGGKKLPPDYDAAMKLVDELDVYPSMIIHSGHGLQAYWILKTPILIENQIQRDKTSEFTRGWLAAVRSHADKRGWTVDAVADLSRVFRIPGTKNLKAEPVDCKIIYPVDADKPRLCSKRELSKFIIAEDMVMASRKKGEDRVNVVTPKENPDIIRRIKMLCEISPKFEKTWDRKRADMTDASASAYDLALANALVAAGATDQEIADVILAWRKRHDEDLNKAMRRDYLMRTIGKARVVSVVDRAIGALDNKEDLVSIHEGDSEEDVARKEATNKQTTIDSISVLFGIDLDRILQQGLENATWSLRLVDGTDVLLGERAATLRQQKVRESIYEATRTSFNILTALQWNKLLNVMGEVTDIEENAEGDRKSIIMGWIQKCTDKKDLKHDWENEFVTGGPFIKKFLKGRWSGEEMLCIQGENLLKYINVNSGVKMTRPAMHDMLRIAGFHSCPLSIRTKDRQIHRKIWVAHPEILEEKPPKST